MMHYCALKLTNMEIERNLCVTCYGFDVEGICTTEHDVQKLFIGF